MNQYVVGNQYVSPHASSLQLGVDVLLSVYFVMAQLSFPSQVQRKVDALLKEFAFRKNQSLRSMSEDDSFDGDSEGDMIYDELELIQKAGAADVLPGMAGAVQELQKRRSRQIRNKQRGWQESEEGRKMNGFRKTLPAYKERDALLAAIERNQVMFAKVAWTCELS
jgi:ATP-dependent RNA helicase DHX36